MEISYYCNTVSFRIRANGCSEQEKSTVVIQRKAEDHQYGK